MYSLTKNQHTCASVAVFREDRFRGLLHVLIWTLQTTTSRHRVHSQTHIDLEARHRTDWRDVSLSAHKISRWASKWRVIVPGSQAKPENVALFMIARHFR